MENLTIKSASSMIYLCKGVRNALPAASYFSENILWTLSIFKSSLNDKKSTVGGIIAWKGERVWFGIA